MKYLFKLSLKFSIIFCMGVSSNCFSEDNFMEFGDINFGRNFKEKSMWIFKSGVEYIKYPSALPEFSGVHEEIKTGEENELNGYGLSFGRDFYISNGFSSAIFINAYYSKTLDKTIGKAAQDIDVDFSQTRTSHQLAAYEASIALNYIYDFKIVDIQPFIEFGVGAGTVSVEKEYTRLGLSVETQGSEDYDVKTEEEFAMSRISIGVNLISYKGLMSYFKATSIQMLKTSRETEGTTNAFGSATVNDVSSNDTNLSETETVTMFSVGIGRYF